MIIHENPYIDENGIKDPDKVKIFSDEGFQIVQNETGRVFDSAVDVYPSVYTYTQANSKVETS